MTKINFTSLVDILKNNKFELYYRYNSKSRNFKDKSTIVIDSDSIRYNGGIITKDDLKDIYIFDNNFVTFHDYKNCRIIEIVLLNKN